MHAAACTPPELQNISINIPRKKLAAKSPVLFPFTGKRIINRI
jgi:hypothetical protein